ncbi:MAG: hypothetical protein MMC33_005228 [Icmadophila ericetorum]|nr:hypothetical protein [Icmadophila ericetorum]
MFGFIPKRTVSAKYEALENESEKGRDSSSLFSEDLSPNTKTRWRFIQLLPWLISATLATLSLYQFLSSRPHPLGTFDSGWKTDFAPARPWVAVEQVKFTGSPAFTENTTYWVPNPGPKKYVGNPSAEIDANWDAITWGRYILITEQEARGAFTEQYGDDLSKFWSPIHGGYYVG